MNANSFPLESSSILEKKILVIVPAFNESGNIGKTVSELLALPLPLTVLVVDDGSGDTTAQEARETGALVISLIFNLGIGGAVQTGFKFAKAKGFTLAVQVDGDGQHDVGYLEKLITPILAGEADMIIGSRFLPPHLGYQSSFVRRIGIQFFSFLLSALTHCRVTDPTSGFRAYNLKMIQMFAESYPHDFPEPEAILIAQSCQARVKEVPVKMRKRITGLSSIRYLKTLYYMIKVTFAILLNKIKKKKESS